MTCTPAGGYQVTTEFKSNTSFFKRWKDERAKFCSRDEIYNDTLDSIRAFEGFVRDQCGGNHLYVGCL